MTDEGLGAGRLVEGFAQMAHAASLLDGGGSRDRLDVPGTLDMVADLVSLLLRDSDDRPDLLSRLVTRVQQAVDPLDSEVEPDPTVVALFARIDLSVEDPERLRRAAGILRARDYPTLEALIETVVGDRPLLDGEELAELGLGVLTESLHALVVPSSVLEDHDFDPFAPLRERPDP